MLGQKLGVSILNLILLNLLEQISARSSLMNKDNACLTPH